jgi:polyphosphate kinase
MPRNLDHRVECLTEVIDPSLQKALDRVVAVEEADDVLAWDLLPKGWTKAPTTEGVEAHEVLRRLAEERERA